MRPPPKTGAVDTHFRAWLASLDKNHLPRRILYISTTGVYGDHQGARVNEQRWSQPHRPIAPSGRLDAETALRQFATVHAIEYIILRVAGIYGVSRLPRKRLQNNRPILHPDIAPITNRIHEVELAQICVTAALNSDNAKIYNISDGEKMTMSKYFIRVAEH